MIAIEQNAVRNQKLHPGLTFELVMGRDDLLERVSELKTTNLSLTLLKLILEEETRLHLILPKLPAAKEKRVVQAFPAALGDRWRAARFSADARQSFAGIRARSARLFVETGNQAELQQTLDRTIREHSATSEMLIWLSKDRANWPELITPGTVQRNPGNHRAGAAQ